MTTTQEQTWRILAVANETVEGALLHDAIRLRAGSVPASEVLVVAPVSDEGGARPLAESRLVRCLGRLADAGVEATGWVAEANPLTAIDAALRAFPADEIIIATHPQGRSHWLAGNLVERARRRFRQPILHVVVDGARHDEYLGIEAA
jgi:hypothetical protein